MAYVLGYIYADGSLENSPLIRGKYIRVSSTDRDRIEAIRICLRSEHTIVTERPPGNRKPRFLLRIGNKKMYEQLMALGLTPNKSLTMLFPNIPKKYLQDFIRGYFDGDGCVFLEEGRGKTKEKIIRRLSVIFTSGSKKFLVDLEKIIAKEVPEVRGHLYIGTRSFQLHYFTKDSVRLFVYLYRRIPSHILRMQRKYAIFEQYFAKRPGVITRPIERILQGASV